MSLVEIKKQLALTQSSDLALAPSTAALDSSPLAFELAQAQDLAVEPSTHSLGD